MHPHLRIYSYVVRQESHPLIIVVTMSLFPPLLWETDISAAEHSSWIINRLFWAALIPPWMGTQQKINENIVWFGTSPLYLLADWKTCVKYSYEGFLNDLSISDEIRTLISQVMTADRPTFDKLRECCFELLEFMFYSVTQSSMQKTSKILSTIKTSGTTLQPDNHPRRVQSSSSSSSRWGFAIIIADVAAAAAVAV